MCVNKQERVRLLLFLINLMEKIRTRDQMREIFIRAVFSRKTRTKKKSDFKVEIHSSDEEESVLYTLLFLNYYAGLFYDANLSTTLLSLEYSS